MNNAKQITTINVKGTTYKIYQTNGELVDFMGRTDMDRKEIILADNLTQDNLIKTLFHELLHATMYECTLYGYFDDELLIHWLDNNVTNISEQVNSVFNHGLKMKNNTNKKIKVRSI